MVEEKLKTFGLCFPFIDQSTKSFTGLGAFRICNPLVPYVSSEGADSRRRGKWDPEGPMGKKQGRRPTTPTSISQDYI